MVFMLTKRKLILCTKTTASFHSAKGPMQILSCTILAQGGTGNVLLAGGVHHLLRTVRKLKCCPSLSLMESQGQRVV